MDHSHLVSSFVLRCGSTTIVEEQHRWGLEDCAINQKGRLDCIRSFRSMTCVHEPTVGCKRCPRYLLHLRNGLHQRRSSHVRVSLLFSMGLGSDVWASQIDDGVKDMHVWMASARGEGGETRNKSGSLETHASWMEGRVHFVVFFHLSMRGFRVVFLVLDHTWMHESPPRVAGGCSSYRSLLCWMLDSLLIFHLDDTLIHLHQGMEGWTGLFGSYGVLFSWWMTPAMPCHVMQEGIAFPSIGKVVHGLHLPPVGICRRGEMLAGSSRCSWWMPWWGGRGMKGKETKPSIQSKDPWSPLSLSINQSIHPSLWVGGTGGIPGSSWWVSSPSGSD